MTCRKKFISQDELVRHKDGSLDLFSTILGRNDTNAQVPVLPDTTHHITPAVPSTRNHPGPIAHISKGDDSTEKNQAQTSLTTDHTTEAWSKPIPNTVKNTQSPKKTETLQPAQKTFEPAKTSTSLTTKRKRGRDYEENKSFRYIFIGYVNDPSSVHMEIQYWHDADHLIIRDKYPKATVHMLIMPRRRIDKVTDLFGQDGVKIVEMLVERANWLIERLQKDYPHLVFQMGFHIIPSILQLHLHVISQDFCSEKLKTKAHWNSFTTSYFVPPELILKTLKEEKSLTLTPAKTLEYEAMFRQELKCNQCKCVAESMPKLKSHLMQHFAALSK
ncbi:hypothetical protein BGX27_006716 [Mortierella sp. AM989]|nr:hypothetical protein BGX27_006716 [Mortierella sp. AM989]